MNWHYCDTIDQRPGGHGLSTFCLIQSFVVCKHNAWTYYCDTMLNVHGCIHLVRLCLMGERGLSYFCLYTVICFLQENCLCLILWHIAQHPWVYVWFDLKGQLVHWLQYVSCTLFMLLVFYFPSVLCNLNLLCMYYVFTIWLVLLHMHVNLYLSVVHSCIFRCVCMDCPSGNCLSMLLCSQFENVWRYTWWF